MRLKRITDAIAEPVTKEEVKADLILTGTADDDLLDRYIKMARYFVENFSKTSIFTQTWEVSFVPTEMWTPLTDMPKDRITLPRSPIQVVNSVTLTDEDGNDTLLAVDIDYRLEGEDLIFVSPDDDPYSRYTVNYDTGYDDSDPLKIPEPYLTAIRLSVTTHYENREQFVIPAGMRQLLAPYRRGRLL